MPERSNQISPPLGIGAEKAAQLSNVALLYYGEGLTQSDIAKRMKVSRATVVNMLRESRALGIVDIRVDGRHLTGSDLARRLCDAFGLEDVYVAQIAAAGSSVPRVEALSQVARVAATAILNIIDAGDRVGVAWGETIMAVANALPRNPVPDVQVCQLIGSMVSSRVPASEQCTIQIAERLDAAACYTLHAPGLVSSGNLAEILRSEPAIAAQLARLGKLDLTVASIGHVGADTHLAAAGMASEQELQAARAAGAVGILCCRYLDAEGQEIDLPPQDRLIAASLADLLAARKRFLVVCGEDRKLATVAALKAGLVTHLCVDQALAQALLDD
jgi:deoxyribonucleoside regulator